VPLLYKGVPVGRIGPADVAPDGSAVVAEAVIDAPYDNLVTEATRFWDASGFSFSIGSGGAAVNFDSIASLSVGGITLMKGASANSSTSWYTDGPSMSIQMKPYGWL
jgi:paraquat-inducible protein B